MARSKTTRSTKSPAAANGSAALLPRLTGDAHELLTRNRDIVAKAVDRFRKDVEKRAQRTVRDVERKILKQMHIATEEQLRSLEARVANLERNTRA